MRESARLFKISEAYFIAAALKQPVLFQQKPETLHHKLPYLTNINVALGIRETDNSQFLSFPPSLCYGTNRLHARYVLAKLGLKRGAYAKLLTLSAAKADQLIIDHFAKQIARTGKGARALQVMHAQGMISRLPEGISPIPRPPKRQRALAKAPVCEG